MDWFSTIASHSEKIENIQSFVGYAHTFLVASSMNVAKYDALLRDSWQTQLSRLSCQMGGDSLFAVLVALTKLMLGE